MLACAAGLLAHPAPPPDPATDPEQGRVAQTERLADERAGTLSIREGAVLRVNSDVGNIRIITQGSPAGRVSYRVRIETDASHPDATQLLKAFTLNAQAIPSGVFINGNVPWKQFRGRLWVTMEINAPRNVHLEISTNAGNVIADDVDGRAVLVSAGGNLTAGHVGAAAKLLTDGGHISVRQVGGDLTAVTAGGHISVETVQGNGNLRSGGGHLKVGTIHGVAQVETNGGDINLSKAGARVMAVSGGGQISFGEAAGSIVARTNGGGIRVLSVAGPMQLETSGGSIYLTRVQGTVSASTASGNITAWFAPEGNKKTGASQLQCQQGDIVVYLPRQLALTIEAVIEMPERDNKVEPDPALPLKVSYVQAPAGTRALRAEGSMNGGGEVLRLRTVSGDIKLRSAEQAAPAAMPSIHYNKLRELQRQQEYQEQVLKQKLEREELVQARMKAEAERTRFQALQARLEELWSRPQRVEADVQRRRLVHSVKPNYPVFARQNRIEGRVQMDVYVNRDGLVEDVRVLSGHPVLASAAQEAVRTWRYQPVMQRSRAIRVVTRVDVEFRLSPN